jgi:hypothetical protein
LRVGVGYQIYPHLVLQLRVVEKDPDIQGSALSNTTPRGTIGLEAAANKWPLPTVDFTIAHRLEVNIGGNEKPLVSISDQLATAKCRPPPKW